MTSWEDVEFDEHEADETRVTPEVRLAVLARDNWRCRSCGEQDLDKLTVHHVTYRSLGGTHDEDNLVTVCWSPCHRLIHEKKLSVIRVGTHWFFWRANSWRNNL